MTQLENQVVFLSEKVNRYENLKEQMTQLMQLVQNQQNHSSKASQVLNFNVLRMYCWRELSMIGEFIGNIV